MQTWIEIKSAFLGHNKCIFWLKYINAFWPAQIIINQ